MQSVISKAHKDLKQAESGLLPHEESRQLFLEAAKAFYRVAEVVDDKTTQTALLYLSASAVSKSEVLRKRRSRAPSLAEINQTGAKAQDDTRKKEGKTAETASKGVALPTDNANDDTNRESYEGRMSLPSASKTHHRIIKELPKAGKLTAFDALNDILLLETKLAEIGLMRGNVPLKASGVAGVGRGSEGDNRPNNKLRAATSRPGDTPQARGDDASAKQLADTHAQRKHLASALGESFMLLSTLQSERQLSANQHVRSLHANKPYSGGTGRIDIQSDDIKRTSGSAQHPYSKAVSGNVNDGGGGEKSVSKNTTSMWAMNVLNWAAGVKQTTNPSQSDTSALSPATHGAHVGARGTGTASAGHAATDSRARGSTELAGHDGNVAHDTALGADTDFQFVEDRSPGFAANELQRSPSNLSLSHLAMSLNDGHYDFSSSQYSGFGWGDDRGDDGGVGMGMSQSTVGHITTQSLAHMDTANAAYDMTVSASNIRKVFSSSQSVSLSQSSMFHSTRNVATPINTNGRRASSPRPAGSGSGQLVTSAETPEGIVRLLHSIKRLGDENANLLQRVEYLQGLETQNKALQRQMDLFKHEYKNRFFKLKAYLKSFSESYPSAQNPANLFASPGHGLSASTANAKNAASGESDIHSDQDKKGGRKGQSNPEADLDDLDDDPDAPFVDRRRSGGGGATGNVDTHGHVTSSTRQRQLEKTVQALLGRLEQAKVDIDKKNKQLNKYENYYRQLRQSVEKREGEKKANNITNAAGNPTSKAPSNVGAGALAMKGGSVIKAQKGATGAVTTTIQQQQQQQGIPGMQSVHNTHSASPQNQHQLLGMQRQTPNRLLPQQRPKHPSTSTLETSLQRSAALEYRDKRG